MDWSSRTRESRRRTIVPAIEDIQRLVEEGDMEQAYKKFLSLAQANTPMLLSPDVEEALYDWEVKQYDKIVTVYFPVDDLTGEYMLLDSMWLAANALLGRGAITRRDANRIMSSYASDFADEEGDFSLGYVLDDDEEEAVANAEALVRESNIVLPASKMLGRVPPFMPEGWRW